MDISLIRLNGLKTCKISAGWTFLPSHFAMMIVHTSKEKGRKEMMTWAARTGSLILLDALPSMASAVDAFRFELILKTSAIGLREYNNSDD